MKFTKNTAAQAGLPPGKSEVILFDDDVRGFGLRVRAGGSRNWIFQYRQGGKQRRISFGSATAMTVGAAREKAEQMHAQVRLGRDPAGEKAETRLQASETIGQVLKAYMAHKRAALRPHSYKEVTRHLLVNAKRLHGLQLAKADRRTIAALLTGMGSGPTEVNRTRASLSAFFGWAMREGLAEANPVIGTNKATEEEPRDRVLSNTELRAVWHALADDDYGAVAKLLMLTGQRRQEIGGLRRSEVDLDKAVISLPAARTKNKRAHDIPLAPPALAILESWLPRRAGTSEYVFGRKAGLQHWSKGKAALDQRLLETGDVLPDWILHDLRRTLSTRMHEELGIAPHVVEAVLNHASGHRAGVAGIYNRSTYAKEKATALARWAEHLEAIVAGTDSKVVALQGGVR